MIIITIVIKENGMENIWFEIYFDYNYIIWEWKNDMIVVLIMFLIIIIIFNEK